MEDKSIFEGNEKDFDKMNGALKRKYISLKKAMGRKIKELEDVKKEFFYFLENQQDGVIMVDLMGRITFCNDAALGICGFNRDEVVNHHFRMFLTLDDLANGFKLFYNVLKGEYSTNNLFRIRCKDGSSKIVEVNASPLHEFGKIVGGISIIRDITKRKRVEFESKERVEQFRQLDADLEEWKLQVSALKHEVDQLLEELGRNRKYEK